MVLQAGVMEPAYDRCGGPAYVALRHSLAAAQDRYFSGLSVHGRKRDPAMPLILPAEVDRLQSALSTARQRLAPEVEKTLRAVAQQYWAKHSRHGLDESFFDDAESASVPARMARIDPAWWWRRFFTKLQSRCKDYHAADGRFLDTLPTLRSQAKKKTLAAHIAEWSETNAAEWGWRGPGHYRMLANRSGKKAAEAISWFDRHAPGYLDSTATRHTLDARLNEFLAEHDPHERLLAVERNTLSEHWRN
ncbi:MAG: hypothetical protein RL077_4510 [Verrucomicrobiota bacterium]